jgi:hypothetical protein
LLRIILGAVGLLCAVGVLVLGAGFITVETTLGGLDPVARGSIPGSLRFDAAATASRSP